MTTIEHDPSEKPGRKSRSLGWIIAAAVAAHVAGGAGLAMATDAVTPGKAAQFATKAGFGGGFGGPRFERILDEIGATDDQADKLWDIAGETVTDMWPMVREFRAARSEAIGLLTAPTIDKAAVEALRADRVAAIDAASKVMADKLVRAAEVLTPEQRVKFVELMEERRSERRWRH